MNFIQVLGCFCLEENRRINLKMHAEIKFWNFLWKIYISSDVIYVRKDRKYKKPMRWNMLSSKKREMKSFSYFVQFLCHAIVSFT